MGIGRRVQPERGDAKDGDHGGDGDDDRERGAEAKELVEQNGAVEREGEETVGEEVDAGEEGNLERCREEEGASEGGKKRGVGGSDDSRKDLPHEPASNEHPGYYSYVPSTSLAQKPSANVQWDKRPSAKEPSVRRPSRSRSSSSRALQPEQGEAGGWSTQMPSKRSKSTKLATKDGSASASNGPNPPEDARNGPHEEGGDEREDRGGGLEEDETSLVCEGGGSETGNSHTSIIGTEASVSGASEANSSPAKR